MIFHYIYSTYSTSLPVNVTVKNNTAVKRNAHVRDLRKRGKNKGKLYTKECRLNKNTKYKKTPENIKWKISEYLPCVKRKFS